MPIIVRHMLHDTESVFLWIGVQDSVVTAMTITSVGMPVSIITVMASVELSKATTASFPTTHGDGCGEFINVLLI